MNTIPLGAALRSRIVCSRAGEVSRFLLVAGLLFAAPFVRSAEKSPPAALDAETQIMVVAHDSARADDDSRADAQLSGNGGAAADVAPSVLLARRTMVVCGWLQNENEYGRAMKLARRTIERLAQSKENNDTDRVERLYWEACLLGTILNERKQAVALLEEARQLAPDDRRIADDEERLARAVARYGR